MKQAAAILDPHGADVTNLPLTEPGKLRDERGGGTKFLYAGGARPLDGYTIKRGIGRGGFGEVYYATSDGGKEVALKLIRRNLDVEVRGVAQCLNLKHPNLLALFDIRRDADDDTWVVMEYVSGETLDDAIGRHPHGMPVPEVLAWMHGIAGGVAYLHDHGIVHRDLKPGNIFREDGIVKLGDYGLSKFISASRRSGQTESVGTVHYMAPEVANGRYGKEIDIYALGIILYEMLSGHVPFEGESVGEVLMKHLTATPDLSAIQEPFRSVLGQILDKDPAKRPQSVAEVISALPKPATLAHFALPPNSAATARPANSVPPPLPSATTAMILVESDEPIWKAFKQISQELRLAWNNAELNAVTRIAILVLIGIVLVSTSGIWIAAMILYALYRIARAIVLIGKKPTVAWVAVLAPAAPVGASAANPLAPPVAAQPARLAPSASPTQGDRLVPEQPVSVVALKTGREKMTELISSMLLSALFSVIACVVVKRLFVELDWGQITWLALVSATGAWAVLLPAKLWEGKPGDEMNRRFVLLLAGLALGFYAWSFDRILLVNLPYSTNPHIRSYMVRVPLGHSPAGSLFASDGSPTLFGYLTYFGFLFPVMRWWQLADPMRRRRFSIVKTAVYGGWAWVLSWFWPFPEFGITAAAIMAFAVQWASPWTDIRGREHWRRG